MPSLTLSEMVAIVLVILIVFGPQRLPEMARKAALLIRRARATLASVREEFESEYHEISGPLREVRDEVAGVRRDLDDSVAAISEDIRRVKEQQAKDPAASPKLDSPSEAEPETSPRPAVGAAGSPPDSEPGTTDRPPNEADAAPADPEAP